MTPLAVRRAEAAVVRAAMRWHCVKGKSWSRDRILCAEGLRVACARLYVASLPARKAAEGRGRKR